MCKITILTFPLHIGISFLKFGQSRSTGNDQINFRINCDMRNSELVVILHETIHTHIQILRTYFRIILDPLWSAHLNEQYQWSLFGLKILLEILLSTTFTLLYFHSCDIFNLNGMQFISVMIRVSWWGRVWSSEIGSCFLMPCSEIG